MGNVESIINGILAAIPKERRAVWVKVLEEKIVGKTNVRMRDLKALEDDECFERLETGGFFKKEQSPLREIRI